jgi:TonB family protein
MKYSIKFTLFLIFTLSINYFSQETTQKDWTNISSPKGDFTISLPPNFLVDKESELQRIYAFIDEAAINVQIEENSQAKTRLKQSRQFPPEKKSQVSRFTNGDFIGDFYNFEEDKSFSVSIYMASSKAFYMIFITSPNGKNPLIEKVIYSLKVDNQPLFKQQNPVNQDIIPSISISTLKTSPTVLEALKIKDAEKTKIKFDLKNKVSEEILDNKTKYSRPLFTVRKPRANYTDIARQNNISGKVKLLVVFRADGQIGDITVIQKLDGGLSEEAAEAARKIKFLPAQLNGKSVDITKTVEYSFTIY